MAIQIWKPSAGHAFATQHASAQMTSQYSDRSAWLQQGLRQQQHSHLKWNCGRMMQCAWLCWLQASMSITLC